MPFTSASSRSSYTQRFNGVGFGRVVSHVVSRHGLALDHLRHQRCAPSASLDVNLNMFLLEQRHYLLVHAHALGGIFDSAGENHRWEDC